MNAPASEPSPSIRLFIALPVSPEVLAALENVIPHLQSKLPPKTIRWTTPGQIHLTLKFLGHVPRASIDPLSTALRELARRIPPLPLRAQKLGAFPSLKNPRVIWAGLQGDLALLKNLHQQVEAGTGSFSARNENRPFHPHLTLGRVREDCRIRLELNAPLLEMDFGAWTAHEILLLESKLSPRGATHTTLCRIPLI
jgi:RNA 2',3'-cyclic 3'-phosphodiesterase